MRFRVCLLLLIAACAGGESTDGKGGPDDSADGGGEGEADGESDGAAPSTLTDLRADAGTLEPTFSPEVTAYTLTLPLQRSSVGLTVTVSAGTPTLDGEPMTAGEAGATATLTIPLDGRSLLLDNAGLESPVTITVARGGSPSTLASASAAGEELGAALSADSALLAAGAVRAGGGLGAVTVLRAGAVEATLAGATVGEAFGAAVAVAGDWLAVGAPLASAGDGAVYLYQHSGGAWTLAATLTAPTAGQAALFGQSLALLASGSLLVGAPGLDPDSRSAAGGAYLYTLSGATWALSTTVTPAELGAGDRFGSAVALRDGALAIGAPGGANGGRVAWGAEAGSLAWLSPTDQNPGDELGAALAFGPSGLLIGAPGRDVGDLSTLTPDAGGAWYLPDSGDLVALEPATAQAFGRFGATVAAASDLLAVGSGNQAQGAGALSLFGYNHLGDPEIWLRRDLVETEAGARFGAAAAFANEGLVTGRPYTAAGGALQQIP
jgi:hypothetical protein